VEGVIGRKHWQWNAGSGLCLAGPEAEKEFCGPINDDSDRADYQMAREYLARSVANPLQAAAELARYRDAATLGAFAFGTSPHSPARGTLTAVQIFELAA
jgi:hypothetical protein